MSTEQFKTSDFEYGLAKIMGQSIKEVHGYISTEFDEPMFKMTSIELEDGTMIQCEGEHDMPYLAYDDKLDEACALIHEEEEAASGVTEEEQEE